MISNSARRTAAPTTMTIPVSTGWWPTHRHVCYTRSSAAPCAVRPGCAEVVS
ncbi:Glucocorticoid induced transcript 1-like protein [Mycolicibacterium rhodesiae JS60]|nr:Glucocorticoid induced transcript 1-like protein [Mycolicibacterium rhodesiae JS60]